MSFIHGASETCTNVPVSIPPSFFKVKVLTWLYVFPSASPTCISLVHLPLISAASAVSETAHKTKVVMAFFMCEILLFLGTCPQSQRFAAEGRLAGLFTFL